MPKGGYRPGAGRKSLAGNAGEKSRIVQIPMPDEDIEALDRFARRNQVRRAQAVRDLVRASLAAPSPTLPLLGRIAAGSPIYAEENIEGWIHGRPAKKGEVLFALRVEGHSMRDVGIMDGGLIIVRQQDHAKDGDIVVALVDGQDATVKRFRLDGDHVLLIPASPHHAPQRYPADRVQIQGLVLETIQIFEE